METDEELTVWCGNLPSQADEELLYELFLQVAPLKKVRIPTDKSGKYMNYGFVTFKHQVSVQYAIDMLNNLQLYDRTIIVRSRNASGGGKNHQQPPPQHQAQTAAINSADLLRLGPGISMMPMMHMSMMPMVPMMMPLPHQQQQHEYHAKERSRHGQNYNDKPYRHHNNHRSNSRNNHRNHYRY